MTQRNRNDAILVKIMHEDDKGQETMVSSYYTTAIDQTFKMFITARDYEIDCSFNEHSSVVPKEYLMMMHSIEDVYLKFGSSEDLPVIEVYI